MKEWSEDKEDPATQAEKCLEQPFGDRQQSSPFLSSSYL